MTTYTASGTLDVQESLEKFAPLVLRMARHLLARLPASVELDDLVQAGMIGLMDAAQRYSPDQGTQFETYATQRVRGAMLDELRENDWLPRSVRKTQRQIEQAMHRAEQQLGRAPSESEIASSLGVPLDAYQTMLTDVRGVQIVSYDDFGSGEDGDDGFLERHGADPDADPAARLHDARFRAALVGGIQELPEREKLVMGMYYEQDLNFREIAAVLGVTESRICQLHGQAVSRLRTRLKSW